MDTLTLAERMKGYEAATRAVLPARSWTILRVDGRAFHTLLRHAARPFDVDVMDAMDNVAQALCREISGAQFAFVQADEATVVFTDLTGTNAQPWFGGNIQKIVSVAASIAATTFNAVYEANPYAAFDARVFTVPSAIEAANCVLWRMQDAARNSVAMAAQARFSHNELRGVSTEAMRLLLASADAWWEDLPEGFKYGRIVERVTGERPVTYEDRRTGEHVTTVAMRSWWETRPAFPVTADEIAETFTARTTEPS